MANVILERWRQGKRTMRFPDASLRLPEAYRGHAELNADLCPGDCRACANACPTGAIEAGPLCLDHGKCLFCGRCADACPKSALSFSGDYRLSASAREELKVEPAQTAPLARPLDEARRKLFSRSLKLRQVSAGGCNACEADFNVLNTVGFDLGRFGIQVVASPRHADGILVTGPVTPNMEAALRDTYAAVPAPKVVIALGTCAVSGGLFAEAETPQHGIPADIPVDLYIPGCPPHPLTILDGLLRLLGRLPDGERETMP